MCLFYVVTLAYGSSGTGSVGQNAGSTKALGTSVSEGRIEVPVGVEGQAPKALLLSVAYSCFSQHI